MPQMCCVRSAIESLTNFIHPIMIVVCDSIIIVLVNAASTYHFRHKTLGHGISTDTNWLNWTIRRVLQIHCARWAIVRCRLSYVVAGSKTTMTISKWSTHHQHQTAENIEFIIQPTDAQLPEINFKFEGDFLLSFRMSFIHCRFDEGEGQAFVVKLRTFALYALYIYIYCPVYIARFTKTLILSIPSILCLHLSRAKRDNRLAGACTVYARHGRLSGNTTMRTCRNNGHIVGRKH